MIDHRLLVLRTFASCGTVTAAADALGYSPSAVSAQLREYQRAVGVRLVVKSGRGLRLTTAGAALVERSDPLFALWEDIHGSLRHIDVTAEPRLLRLGGFSTATGSLLAVVAARLQREHPGLRTEIIEADPALCLELLVADKLDIAVTVAMQTAPEAEGNRLEQVTLLDDPLDVLVPTDHPLADRTSVGLEELAGDLWVADRPGTPYRALFVTAFTAAGVTPQVVHQLSDWNSTEAVVAQGLGVGFVPRLVQLSADGTTVRLPLRGRSAPRRRILALLRRGSQAHDIFTEALDALKQVAADHVAL